MEKFLNINLDNYTGKTEKVLITRQDDEHVIFRFWGSMYMATFDATEGIFRVTDRNGFRVVGGYATKVDLLAWSENAPELERVVDVEDGNFLKAAVIGAVQVLANI